VDEITGIPLNVVGKKRWRVAFICQKTTFVPAIKASIFDRTSFSIVNRTGTNERNKIHRGEKNQPDHR
jgi:hypothetical protein